MVSRFLLTEILPYPAVWNFSTSHLDSFALGILIALNLNSVIIYVKRVRRVKLILIFNALFLVLICSTSIQLVYTSRLSSITYLFAAIIFSLLLVVASFEKWEFRGKKIFMYIGQRSFGLYFFHWPVLYYAKVELRTEFLTIESALVVLAITLVLSELSYRYLESPFMKARVKFQTV
jgi:peptidoglycan/LPS O-acetylase OafA/YrhL